MATPAAWQPAEWSDDRRMGFLMQPVILEDAEAAETKLTFWHDTCMAYLRHAAQAPAAGAAAASAAAAGASTSATPAASLPPLSFTLAEVSKGLTRRGESPAALELVLCRMLQSDLIRRVDRWSPPAPRSAGARVGAYLWSWVSPTKPLQRLPQGRYALVSLVAEEAARLATTLEQQDSDVFTLEQLVQLSGRAPADAQLLAEQLCVEGVHPLVEALPSAAVAGEHNNNLRVPASHVRVFKFGAAAHGPLSVTAADHTRGVLGATLRSLRARCDAKEAAARACEAEARRLLLLKRRSLALVQLQMKRRCLAALDGLHAQMDNIDTLLAALEQADTQKQFMHCITQANQALKQAQVGLSADRVADVADELAEQLQDVQLTEEAISQPMPCASAVDVDAEYAELLAELASEEKSAPAAAAATAGGSGGVAEPQQEVPTSSPAVAAQAASPAKKPVAPARKLVDA